MLQADKRVVGPPVAHAVQAFGQLGLQRHFEAASHGSVRRQGTRRWVHVQREGTIDLYQRRLLHRQWRRRNDALACFQGVAGSGDCVFRLDFPQNRLGARECQLRGCRHHPGHFARFTRWNVNRLRLEFKQRRARADLNFHRHFGSISQRDLRAVLVVLAHQRRQPADDLQILRCLHSGLAGTEQAGAGIGYGDDPERCQRIVERHSHLGLALGIKLYFGVPQQQRVKQLAGVAAATTATCCYRLAAEMSAANNFHLRGRGFHTPGAALQHGFEQVP